MRSLRDAEAMVSGAAAGTTVAVAREFPGQRTSPVRGISLGGSSRVPAYERQRFMRCYWGVFDADCEEEAWKEFGKIEEKQEGVADEDLPHIRFS